MSKDSTYLLVLVLVRILGDCGSHLMILFYLAGICLHCVKLGLLCCVLSLYEYGIYELILYYYFNHLFFLAI